MNRLQMVSLIVVASLLGGCTGFKEWTSEPANVAKLKGWVGTAVAVATVAKPELGIVFSSVSALLSRTATEEPVNLDSLEMDVAALSDDKSVLSIALGAIAIVKNFAADEHKTALAAVAEGMQGMRGVNKETVDFERAAKDATHARSLYLKLK